MSNYKIYIYGISNCGYFNNSINLLNNYTNDNKIIIAKNSINDLKPSINNDFNIKKVLLNNNLFKNHNTSPMIFYGNEKKLLFLGGNDKLTNLIYTIKNNDKNIIYKLNDIYDKNNIITSLVNFLYK